MTDLEKALSDGLDALGVNDHRMSRSRPYTGQPWTDMGLRGATEIKGITFRDLRDAFIRAVIMSAYQIVPAATYHEAAKGEEAALCETDLYGWDTNKIDLMAVEQNLACEIERLMGIFPNVKPGGYDDDPTIRAIKGLSQ